MPPLSQIALVLDDAIITRLPDLTQEAASCLLKLINRHGQDQLFFLKTHCRKLQLGLLLKSWQSNIQVCLVDPDEPEKYGKKIARIHPKGIYVDLDKALCDQANADPAFPPSNVEGVKAIKNVDQLAKKCFVPTSGSSGSAKLVEHYLSELIAAAKSFNAYYDVSERDVFAASLPLHTIGGQMAILRAIAAKACIYLPAALGRWHAQATVASMVPTQLQKALDDEDQVKRLKGLRILLLGGGPVNHQLASRARKLGISACPSYGATETAAIVCGIKPTEPLGTEGFVGGPLPGREVFVDASGVIKVSGIGVSKRVWQFSGLARQSAPPSWQDLGKIDSNGLTVVGRKDDIIISGGKKINPAEVEAALYEATGCQRSIVVGVPSQRYGTTAVVIIPDDYGLDLPALKTMLSGKIARYKFPKAILSTAGGQINSTEKIVRKDWALWATAEIQRIGVPLD